jgi:hypothetical protein
MRRRYAVDVTLAATDADGHREVLLRWHGRLGNRALPRAIDRVTKAAASRNHVPVSLERRRRHRRKVR